MPRWRDEKDREFMRFTKDIHEECRSIRRVIEAVHGPIGDVDWCSSHISDTDPQGILEMPGMEKFSRPGRLMDYWLIMTGLGPPTISGTRRVLRDRDDLREMYEDRAGRIPAQSTVGRFLWTMAADLSHVRAWLIEVLDISAKPWLDPEHRLMADAAEAGIMILEHHQDLVMSGEPVEDRLQEKVAVLREFADLAGHGAPQDQIQQLAEARDRSTRGYPLDPGTEQRILDLAGKILPAGDGTTPEREGE